MPASASDPSAATTASAASRRDRTAARLWRACGESPWAVALGLLVLGRAFTLCVLPLTEFDTDMWWHLAQGRWFVEHLSVPAHDPFSFTSDVPLIAHEWLYDVFTYGLYCLFGERALPLLRVAAVQIDALLMYGLVVWHLRGRSSPFAAAVTGWILTLLAVEVSQRVFLIRPQILVWSLFLALQWLISAWDEGRLQTGRLLGGSALLTLLWVNMHATWVIVPGVLALRVLADVMERRWARVRVGIGAVLLCLCASLVNPGGLHVALHPLAYLSPSLYIDTLTEYKAPSPTHTLVPWFQIVLALDVVVFIVFCLRRRPFVPLVLTVLTRQALSSSRYIPFLAFFLLPSAAKLIAPRLERPRFPGGWVAAVGALALSVWTAMPFLPLHKSLGLNRYPLDALWFMTHNPLPARVFNPFEFGGYMTWATPQLKIFMDGRCFTVYSEQIYKDYLEVVGGGPATLRILDQYGVDVVLVNRILEDRAVETCIQGDSAWWRVFETPRSAVYVRRSAIPSDLRAQLENPLMPDTGTMNDAIGMRLLGAGDVAGARDRFTRAVAIDPDLGEAQLHLGMALALSGRVDEAVSCWEKAARLDPYLKDTHANLGLYHEQHGDAARARREYKAELELNPANERARRGLSRVGD